MPSCPSGSVKRISFVRKSYTRKNGTEVKKVKVPASCIKDRGNKGKGPKVLPKLKKGTLTSFGYSTSKTMDERHKALKKAMKSIGFSSLVKKLNAVSILNKNTNPKISEKFKKDLMWVEKIVRK